MAGIAEKPDYFLNKLIPNYRFSIFSIESIMCIRNTLGSFIISSLLLSGFFL